MNDLADANIEEPVEDLDEPAQPSAYKCGCIFFDDVHMHEHAWVARAGERARYISGTHELPSDTVWITNLDYNLTQFSGLGANTRFRNHKFLRLTPEKIGHLVSLRADEDHARLAEVIAGLFSRNMTLAEAIAGIDEVPINHLRAGLRKQIDPEYDRPVSGRVEQALNQSLGYFKFCERRPMEGEQYTFWMPRIEHARNILRIPLPVGNWRPIKKDELPAASREAVCAWVYEQVRPVLAQITVNWMDPAYSALINFGADVRKLTPGQVWVTQVELMWIAQIAEIEIHQGYRCDDFVEPIAYRQLIDPLGDMGELSLSAGLFAENVWCAASTENPVPKYMQEPGKSYAYPPKPFLRAQDRLQCLKAAIILTSHGFAVTSYGTGAVHAQVPKELSGEQILEAADEAGVMTPPLDLPPEYDIPGRGEDDYQRLARLLHAQDRREELLDLDREIVASIVDEVRGD